MWPSPFFEVTRPGAAMWYDWNCHASLCRDCNHGRCVLRVPEASAQIRDAPGKGQAAGKACAYASLREDFLPFTGPPVKIGARVSSLPGVFKKSLIFPH